MKNVYKTEGFVLYHQIDMSNWCKKRTILKLLKANGCEMHERIFRGLVAYNNILFSEGKRDMYIAHSNEYGYIATIDEAIIRASIADLKSRAFDMLDKSYATEKRLEEIKMRKEYDPLI